MASLQKRNKIYYIVFSKREGEEFAQKKFSLKTKSKRQATKLKIEFEELFDEGKINPFGQWSPKDHFTDKKKAEPSIITLTDLKEKFLRERKYVRQVTRDNYERHLKMLESELGSTIPVTMITEQDMRSYCFQSHLSVATQASYLTHYNAFFNWLEEQGFIEENPMKDIKKPRVQKNISQKTINDKQLKEIFKVHRDDINSKKDQKHITTRPQFRLWFRPVVSIAFYAGLRVKEIVQLKWENVDFNRKHLTITETKSGDERVIPLRSELFQILKAWRRFDRFEGKGLVFPSETGFSETQKMSKENISRVFRGYVDDAELPKSINFHGLRHSCGTELLRMGYDINEVAKILGHSSLDITRIYEHLTANDLSEKMRKLENDVDKQVKQKQELEKKGKRLQELEEQLRKREKELAKQEGALNKSND